jgi:SAM-dependent methyltransferase
MRKDRDAYGQEVLAFYKGKPVPEIVERDDGFIDAASGPKRYFASFKQWPFWQRRASAFVKGRVLDVGAGAGRVALYLQRKCHKVTSIDDSPLAIKVCRMRGVKNAIVLSFERISRFKSSSFDTVVMFGNNFGLLGSRAKAKRLLKVMHRITSDDARIIAESTDPYKTTRLSHLAYHAFNRRRGRMGGQLRLRIRFQSAIGRWFDYLFVSKQEMKEILKGTGWKVRKFIDSGSAYYVAIIEKE